MVISLIKPIVVHGIKLVARDQVPGHLERPSIPVFEKNESYDNCRCSIVKAN